MCIRDRFWPLSRYFTIKYSTIFNGRNYTGTTVVCYKTNRARLRTEDLLLNNAIVFLNTGTSTRFNIGSGTFSAINLLICSSLVPRLSWRVLPDHHGRDHFQRQWALYACWKNEPCWLDRLQGLYIYGCQWKFRRRLYTQFHSCCYFTSCGYPPDLWSFIQTTDTMVEDPIREKQWALNTYERAHRF